jgi:hypothetical protein
MFNAVGGSPTQQLGEAGNILGEAGWDNEGIIVHRVLFGW